jgi:hypothetical protein
MSLLGYLQNPFTGIQKDDSVIPATIGYRHLEVNRWDSINRHLWSRSGFINSFDSTSDPSCPNNLFTTWEDSWEWPEGNDIKAGGRTNVVYKIVGVTKDSNGNPLGGCTVDLFRTSDDLKIDKTISDAAGNYILYTPYPSTNHYCVAYKDPNLAGSTVQTLQGV